MKKLLSLLVALCMTLTGITALAEDATPAASQYNLTVQIDQNFFNAVYADGLAPEDVQLISTFLDLLESAQLSIVGTEDIAKVTLLIGETPVADLSTAVSDDTITIVSSLFPHYALNADVETLSSTDDTTFDITRMAPEEMEALFNDLMLYVNDIAAYIETLKDSAILSEDGTSATIIMTSCHVTEIGEILFARLTTDTLLYSYLEWALAQLNAELQAEGQEPFTLEQVFDMVRMTLDELKNTETQQIAKINTYINEDGSSDTVIDFMGMGLITVDRYTQDGAACTELMLIINEGDPTEDWQSIYDGVLNGTNTEGIIMGINIATADTDTSVTFYTADQYLKTTLYAHNIIMTEETTGAVVNVLQLAFDFMGTGKPVAGIQIVTSAGEAPDALSLEGLTVIDVDTATDEEANAFSMDVVSYGLPSLLSNAQTAAPDQVAKLIQYLMMSIQSAQETEPEPVPEVEAVPETVPAA